jgi:hypothetical protein
MTDYHCFVLRDPIERAYVQDTAQGYLAAWKSLGREKRDRVIGYRAVKPKMLLQGDATDESGTWVRDTWYE